MKRTDKKNIALITGSSRGLGFAIAKELDQKKFRVVLTGRSKIDLEQAVSRLNGKGHIIYPVDFSKEKELDQFLEYLVQEKFIPSILIHNLGGKIEKDVFPLNRKILRYSLQINLEIALKINEKILPFMVKKKWGRIIHVSSDASLTGKASPGYVVAKAALNGYVKAMAQFYAKYNIMICAVLPGIFEHENSVWTKKKLSQPDYYKKRLEQMPLGRFGRPDEIASFITELANSDSMMCAGGLFELCGAAC